MKAVLLCLCVFLPAFLTSIDQGTSGKHVKRSQTRAVKGLYFPALILANYTEDLIGSPDYRKIHVLMSPDDVDESSLRTLFDILSRENPSPIRLDVMVYTDVEQLAVLATGHAATKFPDPKPIQEQEYQWAYYLRAEDRELFRYNPDYPRRGMKTILLRGSE